MNHQTAFLIGFMGSGKTSLGKRAANQLGWEFVDLDHWIEAKVGKTVPVIFEEMGESAFRDMEREALEALSEPAQTPRLISCGGGTPCYGDNMALINRLGTSVYLRQRLGILTQRLTQQRAGRPMLSAVPADELPTFIRELLTKREPYYLQAHHVLSDEELTVAGIVGALQGRSLS
ncbi:shikimate kinase [Pontibacter sp. G13]|uniref:shikimate kinase n=1 Tax=Pontibacter sp. G13 TaxID=3074898 RepID=UPI00288A1540|nr:shikimate kinase [Pontibacter sp. G13]WNJ16805.1 shikimate kinase [Pontibacter sp. G13]